MEKKKNKSLTASKNAEKFWKSIFEEMDNINYSVDSDLESISPEMLISNGNSNNEENLMEQETNNIKSIEKK